MKNWYFQIQTSKRQTIQVHAVVKGETEKAVLVYVLDRVWANTALGYEKIMGFLKWIGNEIDDPEIFTKSKHWTLVSSEGRSDFSYQVEEFWSWHERFSEKYEDVKWSVK